MKCILNRSLLVAIVFILGAGYATTPRPLFEASLKGDSEKMLASLAWVKE